MSLYLFTWNNLHSKWHWSFLAWIFSGFSYTCYTVSSSPKRQMTTVLLHQGKKEKKRRKKKRRHLKFWGAWNGKYLWEKLFLFHQGKALRWPCAVDGVTINKYYNHNTSRCRLVSADFPANNQGQFGWWWRGCNKVKKGYNTKLCHWPNDLFTEQQGILPSGDSCTRKQKQKDCANQSIKMRTLLSRVHYHDCQDVETYSAMDPNRL